MSSAALPAIPAAVDPVTQVFKWVVEGHSESDIRESLVALFPATDASNVLTAVMVRLRDTAGAEPEVVIGWAIEATREVYRRMIEIGDFVGALRAIKQLTDTVTKHVHDGPEEDTEPRKVKASEDGTQKRTPVRKEEEGGGEASSRRKPSRARHRADAPRQKPAKKEPLPKVAPPVL